MKILIAGMPQSGSTALYNIVRFYMEYHDVNNLDKLGSKKTFFSKDKITANGKVHNFSNELSTEELDYIEENFSEWICK